MVSQLSQSWQPNRQTPSPALSPGLQKIQMQKNGTGLVVSGIQTLAEIASPMHCLQDGLI